MIHEFVISAIIFGALGFCVGYYKLDVKFGKFIHELYAKSQNR